MTDQVNPLGSLVAGMAKTIPVASPLPPKPTPKPVESKAPSLGQQGERVSKESLEAAAADVQDYFQQLPTDIKFQVDKTTGVYYFKIVDPKTQEVIRQVPSEEVLAMARKLRELSQSGEKSGVLMDKEG